MVAFQPAGGTLVQGVGSTGRAELLHDVLETAAGDLGHAVGVRTQNEGGVHVTGGCLGGGHALGGGASLVVLARVGKDLGLAGLHEADALDASDLALVDAVGVGVGLDVHPLGVTHKVVGAIRVDDARVVAVDLGRVHHLEVTDSAAHGVHGQVVVLAVGGAAAAQVGAAVHLALGVLHVGAAVQHLAGDGVQGAARLAAQQLGGLHQVVVDGGKQQHIGQLDEAAVLRHSRGDDAHVELLTFGGHTFGQGRGGLGQGVILAELDGLTAILGDGMLLSELVMDQQRLRHINEIVGVEGFHLAGKVVPGGCAGRLVDDCIKQVQHDGQQNEFADGVHVKISLLGRGLKLDVLSPCSSADDFRAVPLGQLGNVILHDKCTLGGRAVFLGPWRPWRGWPSTTCFSVALACIAATPALIWSMWTTS